MAKDYGAYLANHQDASTCFEWSTGAILTTLVTAISANHQIFVQRVTISVTVDAAVSLLFWDTNGSAVRFASCPASPGLGYKLLADFGPKGFGLTAGKNVSVTGSAGLGAVISIEAYQKNITPVAN